MQRIRKHVVMDENNRPVAVQIGYDDWRRIESAIDGSTEVKSPMDLSRHAGKLNWLADGMEYHRQVRGSEVE